MQLVVVVCLEFSRRHMPEGFEQAPVVIPVHPFEGGEVVFHGTPRALLRSRSASATRFVVELS